MMTSYCIRSFCSKSLLVVGLTAIGWLSGIAPETCKDSSWLILGTWAQAQSVPTTPTTSALAPVTSAEINNYALAVLKMEPFRQSAYQQIKEIIGSDEQIPDIACHDLESISALPIRVQDIAQNYCTKSSEIVKNYFPEREAVRFNEITILVEENQDLREKLRSALLLLQQ